MMQGKIYDESVNSDREYLVLSFIDAVFMLSRRMIWEETENGRTRLAAAEGLSLFQCGDGIVDFLFTVAVLHS